MGKIGKFTYFWSGYACGAGGGRVLGLGLVGCSGGVNSGLSGLGSSQTSSGGVAGAKLSGSVHGGQQPIVGAHVYLFAANTTDYGGNGIAASSSNASVSLLTSAANTSLDSSGGATNGDYYVTTDANGAFTITGDYTCAANSLVYLYAVGGNPGAGANSAAGLMAVLGNCPAAGNFLAATPYIAVNEVSTVAAAYAMAGFATDATHVSSSGTALAQVGIANAFANAGNLETLSTGVALTYDSGLGQADSTTLNTLADILAACVNTNGVVSGPASPSNCYTLFSNAQSSGLSGLMPSDTATAAINIAHNPGANPSALFALVTAQSPFTPSAPFPLPAYLLSITFLPSKMSGLAIDGSGNVWFTLGTANRVVEISSSGSLISSFNGGGISNPQGIAIDKSGNAWVANYGAGVTEISSSGSYLSGASGYTAGGLSTPTSVAVDGAGDVWVTSLFGDTVEFSGSGSVLSGQYGYIGGDGGNSIAIDGSGNAWLAASSGSRVVELSSTGSVLSGSSGFNGFDLIGASGIALDGSGNAWVTAIRNVVKLSNTGSILANQQLDYVFGTAVDGNGAVWVADDTSNGLCCNYVAELSSQDFLVTSTTSGLGSAMAVDGSGNVWMTTSTGATEFVGAAAPVITPIAAGLPAVPTTDGSSKLGTRP
jgi:streptogramin lyase